MGINEGTSWEKSIKRASTIRNASKWNKENEKIIVFIVVSYLFWTFVQNLMLTWDHNPQKMDEERNVSSVCVFSNITHFQIDHEIKNKSHIWITELMNNFNKKHDVPIPLANWNTQQFVKQKISVSEKVINWKPHTFQFL